MEASIEVNWGDDTRWYVLMVRRAPWTWDDYHAAYAEAYRLIRAVDHVVDIISDNAQYAEAPDGNAIGHVKSVWDARPPNLGRIILLGVDSNIFARNLLRIFANAFGGSSVLLFAASMDDALRMVRERDQQSGA